MKTPENWITLKMEFLRTALETDWITAIQADAREAVEKENQALKEKYEGR